MKLGYAIPHKIIIRASANMGFIVKIGCGEFVAADRIGLINSLNVYLEDAVKWETEYNKLPGRGEVEQGDVNLCQNVEQPQEWHFPIYRCYDQGRCEA